MALNAATGMKIDSSTFYQNVVSAASSIISNAGTPFTVTRSTFYKNKGTCVLSYESVTIQDSIINCTTTSSQYDLRLSGSTSLIVNSAFTTYYINIISDPVVPITPSGILDLADNGGFTPTCAITTTSSAYNAGSLTTSGGLTDQRGADRVCGSKSDIGAYELESGACLGPPLLNYGCTSPSTSVSATLSIASSISLSPSIATNNLCGNGVLNNGEECDYADPLIDAKCCNSTSCQFVSDSKFTCSGESRCNEAGRCKAGVCVAGKRKSSCDRTKAPEHKSTKTKPPSSHPSQPADAVTQTGGWHLMTIGALAVFALQWL
eukprot:TRINITY_DN2979_c0_g2_i1.p1 TRINITY_DN2979_c0_g2~~TRINITY_DN2979_c0_g2_i1.p1  ORF type:complete len:320 (+),score=52.64 TRINITY_DN2979_c0_g2_i1:719-1678(+)